MLLLGNGWRLPTSLEWIAADGYPQYWNSIEDTYNSILRLHSPGYLSREGELLDRGTSGYYWSSTYRNYDVGCFYNSNGISSGIKDKYLDCLFVV